MIKPTLLASALTATLSLAAVPVLHAQDTAADTATTGTAGTEASGTEASGTEADATEAPAVESADIDTSTLSYALGMLIGESVANFEELDYARLAKALETQHQGGETEMSMMEAQQTMEQYQIAQTEAAAAEAKATGDAFLAENAAREGVQVTDSGLQYEVLSDAEGDKPTSEDTVKVHYEGKLIDGTVFDSSIERGEPAQFPLKGVIPGWTEGLQLMPVGSKYRFVIPADLAYGDRGAGQAIGPGETLIFDVELLEIVKQ